MNCKELFDKLSDINRDAYIGVMREYEKKGEEYDEAGYTEYIKRAEAAEQALIPEIEEGTADWDRAEWEKLFYQYTDNCDIEIFAYMAEKIIEACGEDFLARCIEENIEFIENNVYFNTNSEHILRQSDILFTAVKLLNRLNRGGVDKYISEAFERCAAANEHIIEVLAEYIARECINKVPEYISNENFDDEKTCTLINIVIKNKAVNDDIYQAIKKRFKSMPDDSEYKLLLTGLLSDYGNPNAILMMRRYAKSLAAIYDKNHDKELFTNIMLVLSNIESLGGLTDDIIQ